MNKNVITKEELIESLIYQLDNLPSLLSVLYENKILAPDKILEVINLQITECSELHSVLISHHFLSENKFERVLQLQSKKRVSLGQILVKKKIITIQDAQILLTEFLDQETSVTEQKTEPEQNHSVNIPDPEFEKYFDGLIMDEAIIKEYLEVFDDDKKDSLELSVLEWIKFHKAGSSQELKDSYRAFYRELHTIKGTARFLKAHVSEFFIHHLEELLSTMQQVASVLKIEDCEEIESHYLNGVDFIWELRNELKTCQSEKVVWLKSEWKRNCMNYLQKTTDMKLALDCKDMNISEEDFGDQF